MERTEKRLWLGVDNTDDFCHDIYQDPDYEGIEQLEIDLEQDDEISGGEKELWASTQEGSEGHSDVQMSIQDEIKGDALNEDTEAEKLRTSKIIHWMIRHIHWTIRVQ